MEFFQEVRDHLTEDGVVAINVGHTADKSDRPRDWRLVAAMVATMRQIYPSVSVLDVPGSLNAIVVATVQTTSVQNLADNLPLLADARLQTVANWALANVRDIMPSDVVFTDDRAPVEQFTHDLALRYVLGIR